MKNKKTKAIVKYMSIILSVVILGAATYAIFSVWPYLFMESVKPEDLDQINLDNYNKLMIVAHPDDELIWGGCHLIEDNYFVVCITCGDNETRSEEFKKVIEKTGSKGMILSYPDKIMGLRSNWILWKDDIEKDLETIINYKDWEVIVTHNKNGEYGHIHHKMLHKITNLVCENTGNDDVQQYFGRYYRKKNVPENLESVNEDSLSKKEEISKLYVSQKRTIEMFHHMFSHENWTER